MTIVELQSENAELRRRLAEAEEALAAIRSGQVDAIITDGAAGPQVFSLAGTETVYRLAVETMAEAALSVSPDGTILFCNARFSELVATPLEQLLGRDLDDFLPPEDHDNFRELFAHCLQEPVKRRVVFRAACGTLKSALLSGCALTLGDETGICLVASDLTELENSTQQIEQLRQAQAELRESRRTALNIMEDALESRHQAEQSAAALRESEERLHFVLESCRIGTWEMDVAAQTTIRSPEHDSIYGYSVMLPEWTYTMFLEHVVPEDCERVDSVYQEAVRTQSRWSFEFRIRRADGEIRWIWAVGDHRHEERGAVRRVAGIVVDITDRKQIEEALRESRNDLARAQEVGAIGCWRLDVRSNVLIWSDENYRIFGISQGTPLSYDSFLTVVHPDDRPYVDAQWQAGLRGAPYDIEHRLLVAGQVKWVREKAYLEFEYDGSLIGGFGITQDITERKLAEEELECRERDLRKLNEELRISERRYRDLVEQTPDGIFVADPRGFYCDVNSAGAEMLGYPREELLGMNIADIIIPEEVPRIGSEVARFAAGGVVRSEWVFRRKDGTDFIGEVVGRQLDDGRLQAILRDITEWKESNRQITLQARMLDAVGQAVIATGLDHSVIYWNKSAERMFGWTDEEVRGKLLNRLLPSNFSSQKQEEISKALRQGASWSGEITVECRDGHCIPLLTMNSPVYSEQGQPLAIIGVGTDISERKQIEESLRDSILRLDLLAETASNLLKSSSPQHVVESLCRKVMTFLDCQMFFNFLVDDVSDRLHLNACAGIPDQEAQRIEWLDYGVAVCGCAARDGCRIVAEDIPAANDPRTELVKSYGALAYACHPLLVSGKVLGTLSFGTRTRSSFSNEDLALMKAVTDHVAIAMARQKNEAALQQSHDLLERRVAARTEELANMVTVLENEIRERIQAERTLREETLQRLQMMDELRRQEQIMIQQSRQAAMGEMIGNIAHQWRQPLNTLGLLTQRIGYFYDTPSFTKEFLDASVAKSMDLIQHMSKTIDDFRNYFKPDKEKSEFNVKMVIETTLSLMEGMLQEPKINIDIIGPDKPVVYGYQNEFAQVILNILTNARDALLERHISDANVTIMICTGNDSVVITIADNAGGIPEEILANIFDPYFTTKGPQQGTGIGLFMSKTIIEKNMNGRLTVRNTDVGAEFRIEL